MRNYVIINGVNSLTIQGLAIKTLPPITKPIQRNLREEIDGRDGDIVTTLGYGAYDKTVEIGLFGTFDIDEVIAYFNQKGTITFSNEADKVYYFEALDQVDYAELLKFRTANVVLHCQPFKYPTEETPLEEEYEYITGTGTNITLDNTSEAIFNKIDLLGNTEQQTIEGINKFNKDGNLSTLQAANNQAQITKTNEQISFVTTGQNAAGFYITSNIWHNYVDNFDSTKTYTISADVTLSASAQLKFGVESNATFQTYSGKQRISNTTNASSINAAIVVYLYNNTIGTQVTVENIQIEEGTTAHDFVPYVGSMTSPNPNYPQDIHVVSGDNEITICGKNIFDDSNVTNLWSDYNTQKIINQNGSNLHRYECSQGDTFTIQATFESASGQGAILIQFFDKDGNSLGRHAYSNSTSLTLTRTAPANTSYAYMGRYLVAPATIQIKRSSQGTTYEPYEGQTFPLYLGVENLAQITATGSYNCTLSDGVFTSISYSGYGNIRPAITQITLPANKTIYYSADIRLKSGTSSGALNNMAIFGTTNTYTTNKLVNPTISSEFQRYIFSITPTIDEPAKGLLIQTNSSSSNAVIEIKNIMISYSYSHDFYEYGQTPIEMTLAGNFNDLFVKENDTWYKREYLKKITLNGTENGWSRSGASTDDYFVAAFQLKNQGYLNKYQTSQYWLSNRFVFGGLGRDGTFLGYNGNEATGHDLIGFTIKSSIANTIGDFKTWVGTHNIELLYIRLEAEDIEITNETLIDQLEAIKNAISYKGQTNISQTNYDMPFILDLSALKKDSDHLVIDNIGNIYSKPTLDLEGTGIVDIYLNDTQMFEVDLSEKNEIVIDTEKMEAYNPTDNTLANRQVTGDYSKFKLDSGENDLRFSGNLTKATITNYERWL